MVCCGLLESHGSYSQTTYFNPGVRGATSSQGGRYMRENSALFLHSPGLSGRTGNCTRQSHFSSINTQSLPRVVSSLERYSLVSPSTGPLERNFSFFFFKIFIYLFYLRGCGMEGFKTKVSLCILDCPGTHSIDGF